MITSKSKKQKSSVVDIKVKSIFFPAKVARKKVNFMVNQETLEALKKWIPAGDRSDFVNGALEDAVRRYTKEKAFQMIDELREKAKIRMSTAEMIKFKNYGSVVLPNLRTDFPKN
ncbi:hypothetical protein HZC21_05970 [Candidatus Peregrinibacteria bacterium]|nr:hypothetical protein [Candidatus Peregrinibacteria bacterium]